MEDLNFEFIKNRNIGDLIQDFLSLFKQIFKHFHKNVLGFLLPAMAIFLILFFFASSLGVNIFYTEQWDSPVSIASMIIVAIALLFFFSIFISTFALEYVILLKERQNTSFSGVEVWSRIKQNLRKYILFFLSMLVVGLIVAIPFAIVSVILLIIPLIGSIAYGILISCLSVVLVGALFLYREDREVLFGSYMAAFSMVHSKLLSYGLAAYVFRFLMGISLALLTAVPGVILALIAYNTIGFNDDFFVTFTGKLLVSLGGSILMLMITLSTLYGMMFYALIYYSSLEVAHQEGTLQEIEQIGEGGSSSKGTHG